MSLWATIYPGSESWVSQRPLHLHRCHFDPSTAISMSEPEENRRLWTNFFGASSGSSSDKLDGPNLEVDT